VRPPTVRPPIETPFGTTAERLALGAAAPEAIAANVTRSTNRFTGGIVGPRTGEM
jgi:hypothetical protein